MGGSKNDLLTTREAARLLGVGTTSIKRWADSGVLECVRTPGRHRRFDRDAVESMAGTPVTNDEQVAYAHDPHVDDWIEALTADAPETPVEHVFRSERERLGSWWRVAESLTPVLSEIGVRWQRGELSILEEHLASERLMRAVAACGDRLVADAGAPRALLMVAEGEQHTLGLALAELCLREAGWFSVWAGRRTPIREVRDYLYTGAAELVAVSASASFSDSAALRAQARALADACRAANDVALVVGGNGDWPDPLEYGTRVCSFAELHKVIQLDH